MFNLNFLKQEREVRKFFIIFYIIGFLGITIPPTRSLFIFLTPFALLISIAYIIYFHQGKYNLKTIAVYISIYFTGFLIEVAGVKTGMIFGHYSYGTGLGLKLMETPLIIGINWLLLVYCTASIFEKRSIPVFLKILFASLLMVIYDLVMEQVAPHLKMWYFDEGEVPLRNYLSWFILAFLMQSLMKLAGVKTENKIADLIFYCQLSFFGALVIFYTVLK
jgi:putative membrane protein